MRKLLAPFVVSVLAVVLLVIFWPRTAVRSRSTEPLPRHTEPVGERATESARVHPEEPFSRRAEQVGDIRTTEPRPKPELPTKSMDCGPIERQKAICEQQVAEFDARLSAVQAEATRYREEAGAQERDVERLEQSNKVLTEAAHHLEQRPAESPAPPPASDLQTFHPLRIYRVHHDTDVYKRTDREAEVVSRPSRDQLIRVVGVVGEWLEVQSQASELGYVRRADADPYLP